MANKHIAREFFEAYLPLDISSLVNFDSLKLKSETYIGGVRRNRRKFRLVSLCYLWIDSAFSVSRNQEPCRSTINQLSKCNWITVCDPITIFFSKQIAV